MGIFHGLYSTLDSLLLIYLSYHLSFCYLLFHSHFAYAHRMIDLVKGKSRFVQLTQIEWKKSGLAIMNAKLT